MNNHKKASDYEVLEAYRRNRSVWKAAKDLGMCGQSVHERLEKLGAIKKMRVFTKEEEQTLLEEYVKHRNAGTLQILADRMGRTKQFICRKARDIGLTDISRWYRESRLVVDAMGYVAHRGKGPHGCKHEHRVIAEKLAGRTLGPDEVVHHIDGDKTNNSPDNLRIMTREEHGILHGMAWAKRRAGEAPQEAA